MLDSGSDEPPIDQGQPAIDLRLRAFAKSGLIHPCSIKSGAGEHEQQQGYQRAAWFLPALPVSNDGSESLQLWFGWLGFRFRSLNFDLFELRCLQFGSIDFCENRVVGKDG